MKPSEIQAELAELHKTIGPAYAGVEAARKATAQQVANLSKVVEGESMSEAKRQEIAAAKAAGQSQVDALIASVSTEVARAEELRQIRAPIINEYGAKLRFLRTSGAMHLDAFRAFRRAIYAESDQDARMTMIDSRLDELGLRFGA